MPLPAPGATSGLPSMMASTKILHQERVRAFGTFSTGISSGAWFRFHKTFLATVLLKWIMSVALCVVRGNFVVLQNRAAPMVPAHLQSIGARRFAAGAADERAGRAPSRHSRYAVTLSSTSILYGNVRAGRSRGYFCRHATEPLEHVEIVQALVDEHAAAFAAPRRAPAAAFVIYLRAEPIGVDPVHAHDLAQRAVGDEFFQQAIFWLHAHLEHGAEDELALAAMRSDEFLRIGFVGGDGFLHHHVQVGV